MKLTAVFKKAKEGGYVCWLEEIPEAMSQGKNIDEAKLNLLDALQLVLECKKEDAEKEPSSDKNVIRKEIQFSAC